MSAQSFEAWWRTAPGYSSPEDAAQAAWNAALTPPEARKDEFTAEEKFAALNDFEARYAALRKEERTSRAPAELLYHKIATDLQATVNRLRAAIAGAKVTYRVEQLMNADDDEWVRLVAHSEQSRVEPYMQRSRFPIRLVRIATISEVISVRSAGEK